MSFSAPTRTITAAILIVGIQGAGAIDSEQELSPQEKLLGSNFEMRVENDPEGRKYMLKFSDPNYFSHTSRLRKVWGSARVIDGQTLAVDGKTIRLSGIRAPDISQTCKDKSGQPFNAGGYALARLKAKVPSHKAVVCYAEPSEPNQGTCFIWGFGGPINIARLLVREGAVWAWPIGSSQYTRDEGWAEGAASKERAPAMANIWHADCVRPE
jgi:endonuclease YncB( thermonuclease family)